MRNQSRTQVQWREFCATISILFLRFNVCTLLLILYYLMEQNVIVVCYKWYLRMINIRKYLSNNRKMLWYSKMKNYRWQRVFKYLGILIKLANKGRKVEMKFSFGAWTLTERDSKRHNVISEIKLPWLYFLVNFVLILSISKFVGTLSI